MRSERKRRVAHLTSVHAPSDPRIVVKECATLAAVGYDVVLVAAGDGSTLPPGVRFRSVPRPRNRFERITKTVWSVYRAAVQERADVYHFHDPELMLVGLALRLRGASVVFDVHEDIPEDIADKPWIPRPLRKPAALVSAMVLRVFNRLYSAIVPATPAIARRFPYGRTVVVCNYPRIEEFNVQAGADFAQRSETALYLGGITVLRCIEQMVRAFESPEMDPAIRLTLAGEFEDEALEARVRAMPGWKRVDYLGMRRRSEVPGILNGARAGLLIFMPSGNHEDAMPAKLFEYMAMGLPVIISSTLRCSDIVADAGFGLVVDPFEVDALARAITYLVKNPAVAQEMGERGRRLVNERYQWTTEAAKLTKLYAEIA